MNVTYIGRQVTIYDDMKQLVEKKLAIGCSGEPPTAF